MAKAADTLSGRTGCLVFGALFFLSGCFFLWMFFSGDAFHARGNPYMALFFGAACAVIGLLALLVGGTSFERAPRRNRPRPPGRLP